MEPATCGGLVCGIATVALICGCAKVSYDCTRGRYIKSDYCGPPLPPPYFPRRYKQPEKPVTARLIVPYTNKEKTLLLKLGKDKINASKKANVSGKSGVKLLNKAVTRNDTNVVSQLINAGAGIKTPKKGDSPLMIAVRHRNIEMAGILIGQLSKEDINVVKKLSFGKKDVLDHYNDGINHPIKQKSFKGETSALIEACESNQADMVSLLVKGGADVNQDLRAYSWNNERETPLMVAARTGAPGVIRVLLKAGADIDAQDPVSGRTALLYALENENQVCASLLISNGANPDIATNDFGYTPLHTASINGMSECVKALIRAGADLDKKSGHSPEMKADVANQTPYQVLASLHDEYSLYYEEERGKGGHCYMKMQEWEECMNILKDAKMRNEQH